MRPIGRRWVRAGLGALLAIASQGCRSADAPVQELFALRNQGLLYLQRGQLPEAEEQFERLVELAPDEPLGHANLGLTHLRAGRFEEAEDRLRRARRLDPASVDIGLMLAKLYALTERQEESRELLEEMLGESQGDARVLYALAELEGEAPQGAAAQRQEQRLREVLAVAPANLAVRLRLADALLRRGEADSVIRHLEEVQRIPPDPPEDAAPFLTEALRLLRAGSAAAARAPFDRFREAMELTAPYQSSLAAVAWEEGPLVGRPVLTFLPEEPATLRGAQDTATADALRFIDATAEAGLPPAAAGGPAAATVLATGDVDGDGRDDLLTAAAGSPEARLLRALGGAFMDVTARSGISLPAGTVDAVFADHDNDGWLDLFVIGGDGRGRLFRNRRDATFEDVTSAAGVGEVRGARRAVFVDLDHDGDLDLLLVGEGGSAVYRNNLDGTFADATGAFGLGGARATDAAFGDFDADGRVDLLLSGGSAGVLLLRNEGARRFQDATAASGLSGAGVAVVGDVDNDGLLDVLVAGQAAGGAALWTGRGDGTFAREGSSDTSLRGLVGGPEGELALVDVDNDGWLDVIAAGGSGDTGPRLLRNEGGALVDRAGILPEGATGSALAATDADADGDQDLLLGGVDGAVRLLRNDGGNLSRAMRVQLAALGTGSGKNNDFGIGARLELRVGELRQTRVVTEWVTHFGLGPHLKADVLRVEWPNGVPQVLYFPGTDADVLELEQLKGSCAFLYTWDGERFRFVTDVMWRSALGMPLGLMGRSGGTMWASAAPSQEYLRIPGDALRPRDGRYVIQLTEELWETAYVDEVRLLAVDHPDSVDIFVDERFVPPGPPELRIFRSARARAPLSAVDGKGTDLLPALRAKDDVYVSNLVPLRYQGLVEPHDLVMDLGPEAGAAGTRLFLQGWIYPTDASINVALSQQSELAPSAPSLEVIGADGRWTTVVPDLGFPSGKDKTMVIELAGIFPTADHRVRIRTNLQIYWDHAFVSAEPATEQVRVTTLEPLSADLHFRGFSRTYRKGGRHGPHWFAYDDVSEESPWRPIAGAFTRFGDVLPLLGNPDDMYVVMAPGDETTIEFDAAAAGPVPPGWKRDFLLYSDGWIKDSDLNTAFGDTVEPLPFHGIQQYPYAPGEGYPASPEHRRYLREYNTRVTTRR
jgi:hypothetical protein